MVPREVPVILNQVHGSLCLQSLAVEACRPSLSGQIRSWAGIKYIWNEKCRNCGIFILQLKAFSSWERKQFSLKFQSSFSDDLKCPARAPEKAVCRRTQMQIYYQLRPGSLPNRQLGRPGDLIVLEVLGSHVV